MVGININGFYQLTDLVCSQPQVVLVYDLLKSKAGDIADDFAEAVMIKNMSDQ